MLAGSQIESHVGWSGRVSWLGGYSAGELLYGVLQPRRRGELTPKTEASE